MSHGVGGRPVFPPVVSLHLVKLACELPDSAGRSLSLWTCAELARSLREAAVVESISPQTVQRILGSHRLKPWRVHHWLSPKTPRDEAFQEQVLNLRDLYTRPLLPFERFFCADEKTSLQPERARAHLDRRSPVSLRGSSTSTRARAPCICSPPSTLARGEVIGICRGRKRQLEFIDLLEEIDRDTPSSITLIHIVAENLSTYHGKLVRA